MIFKRPLNLQNLQGGGGRGEGGGRRGKVEERKEGEERMEGCE